MIVNYAISSVEFDIGRRKGLSSPMMGSMSSRISQHKSVKSKAVRLSEQIGGVCLIPEEKVQYWTRKHPPRSVQKFLQGLKPDNQNVLGLEKEDANTKFRISGSNSQKTE